MPQHKIDRNSDQLFGLARHVEQFVSAHVAIGIECHQQIDIATRGRLARRKGTKNIQTLNRQTQSERSKTDRDFGQMQRMSAINHQSGFHHLRFAGR